MRGGPKYDPWWAWWLAGALLISAPLMVYAMIWWDSPSLHEDRVPPAMEDTPDPYP